MQFDAEVQLKVAGTVSLISVGGVVLPVEASTAVLSERGAILGSDIAVATCSLSCSETTNDVAGFPPSDSASPALSAYGTLTSRTLGCSALPTMMLSQRASPEVKRSMGSPSGCIAPSRTL